MNKTIIDVKELKKSYKNQKVLKGVTLKVREGEIFALLGSNGAGKTTTIKILSTLINADIGKATLCGYDSEKNSKQVRENISVTGQFAAVDEVLTGEENLKLIAELRGEKNSFEVANFFLEEFDLKHAKDKKVENYSGGMRRRLDISMSLVGNPKILFLDEPTTGLDPQSRNLMWKIIRSLSSNGTTIFLTTQYLDEAEQLADNIAILNEGKIVAEGTADELKKQIPEGLVELEFSDEEDYLNAKLMLSDFELSKDDKMLTLGIVSDNSFENFLGLLNSFKNKGLNISKITQKQPSLEDVFLHVINSNSIGGNSNE